MSYLMHWYMIIIIHGGLGDRVGGEGREEGVRGRKEGGLARG